jgi:hypothetical protein
MKQILIFFLMIFLFATNSFAQKITGFGGELSMLSFKPNVRMWVSKTTGFEVFGGIASELDDFKPDDLEAGFKFLQTILYNRTDRTYIGIVGKWKWLNILSTTDKTNLPVPGLLIGKEWYRKRAWLRGLAIELGYQYGSKEYQIYNVNHIHTGSYQFSEFPLILNLRYTLYKKK